MFMILLVALPEAQFSLPAVAKSMSRVARASGMRASMPLPPLRMKRPELLENTRQRNRSLSI